MTPPPFFRKFQCPTPPPPRNFQCLLCVCGGGGGGGGGCYGYFLELHITMGVIFMAVSFKFKWPILMCFCCSSAVTCEHCKVVSFCES